MATELTCLLTVHGIGFQQPPVGDQAGYADQFHTLLAAPTALGSALGNDPNRLAGPVYVQSCWDGSRTAGLDRLGTRTATGGIDISLAPLVAAPAEQQPQPRYAHVALVYSDLEDTGPRPGSTVDTLARATVSFGRYAHPLAGAGMIVGDLAELLHHHPRPAGRSDRSSLRARTDVNTRAATASHQPHDLLRHTLLAHGPQPIRDDLGVLTALENDVASYVCRNDLRQRLYGFVAEALYRLSHRDDVDVIVLNTHSQGTVLAFDVLSRNAPNKVRALVTAGSPLRKYVDLFAWGTDAGQMGQLDPGFRWLNVYDERDPVADPLAPPSTWRLGEPIPTGEDTLFHFVKDRRDLDEKHNCPTRDHVVDNLTYSLGGGLRAHNYWDNDKQFIPLLSGLMQSVTPVPPDQGAARQELLAQASERHSSGSQWRP
ncbi:MAG: hypothetical protein JO100_15715 [Pseudonocardia sp.]|nr:hypothetical protein [Pseudonocardia sp.]